MASSSRELSQHEHDHRGTDGIRRDIERNRRELDVLADALEAKMSPRTIADELWGNVKDRFGETGASFFNEVRQHPLPLALIGAGIAWFAIEASTGRSLKTYRPDYYPSESYDAEYGSEHGSEQGSQHGSKSTGGRLKQKVRDLKDRAADATHQVRDKASELRSRASSSAHRASEGFQENLDAYPLAMGAAALGLGLVAGMAVPATHKEDEWMGEARDRMLERAGEAGVDMADRARQAVENTADDGE